MNLIVYLFLSTIVLVGVTTAIVYQFTQRFFLIPSAVVMAVGLFYSVESYIMADSWYALNYLFVFMAMILGTTIGALSPMLLKKE